MTSAGYPYESLVVNAKNGGIANVVVFLYRPRKSDLLPVHPSYGETASDNVIRTNKQCRFDPHVALLRTTQTLVIKNVDEVGHNTKIDMMLNPSINPITPAGGSIEQHFSKREPQPARVSCSIHPWMGGWVLVNDTPYFAATDKDGKFEIRNLPKAKWTFQFWHEKAGYVRDLTRDGKKTEWKKGRLTMQIETGENDLGELKVSPAIFE